MKRRKFLTAASLAMGGMLIPVGCNSWIARGSSSNSRKRLVVVFLRGGVDGLNILVPHQSAEYYQARPTLAVPYPQTKDGAIDLEGFFGLNPYLKDLMPWWNNKSLAFVHASGSPVIERSHFQAQDYWENGTPGLKNTSDGWMNRLLGELPQDIPTQALNVGVTTPYILKGKMAIASLKPGKNSTATIPIDRPPVHQAFSNLYSGTDALSKAYQNGKKAREIVLADLNQEMMSASRGAQSPNAFVDDATEVAKLMVGNAKTQLAFMEVGGWDTHVNQNPVFKRMLPSLGEGLATLAQGLQPIFDDTVIVVMSEFGRTVKENGNRGTDHGYGNAMWLMGGSVRGGKIYGDWTDLKQSLLFENRDLPVTTDFREVFSVVLQRHLSISNGSLNKIFPDYQPTNKTNLLA